MVTLNDGALKAAQEKIMPGILQYDCGKHMETYVKNGGAMNAEPEFSGKYIDICTKYYLETGDKRYLQNAEAVVEAIVKQAENGGYLGMLEEEFRWSNFDVWNQSFTVLGLLSYYSAVHDGRALAAAEKCGLYIAKHYLEHPEINILAAENYGTQHISFLCVLPELYELTKNETLRIFMLYIVNRIKNSPLNFFSFDDILELQSPKAIENFVVLIGMLRYGSCTGDKSASEGAKKYWQQVADTQIRNTGNGTLQELWTRNGNAPALLTEDMRPNETCVAVGWIELSMMLFYESGETKYLDAAERTLFNHMLGSLSEQGTDFAYYQPNFGNKIFSTSEDKYKCCRYRGFTLFAYLNDMLYYADGECIIPMIYCDSVYEDETVKISQHTNYPYDFTLKFDVEYKSEPMRVLKLRIPSWCEKHHASSEGDIRILREKDGYIEAVGSGRIELTFECEVKKEEGIINGKEYASFAYGPILLAAVSTEGIESICLDKGALPKKTAAEENSLTYTAGEVTLRDYASAGRRENEQYTVWIPIK